MAKKNFNAWELQQKVNEVDNKAEQTYVDEKVNTINTNINTINSSLDTKANKTDVNDKFSKVNSSLEEKAKQTDLEVERARINTLVKIDSGATEGNTELLDIRVGADGNTHETAGDSVRLSQKGTLIDYNDTPLFFGYSSIFNLTWENGGITYTTGADNKDKGVYRTPSSSKVVIPNSLLVKNLDTTKLKWRLFKYDKTSGDFIGYGGWYTDSERLISCEENTEYRFVITTTSSEYVLNVAEILSTIKFFNTDDKIDNFETLNNKIETFDSTINEKINYSKLALSFVYNKCLEYSLEAGTIAPNNGNYAKSTSCARTEKTKKLSFLGNIDIINSNPTVYKYRLIIYDTDDTFISALGWRNTKKHTETIETGKLYSIVIENLNGDDIDIQDVFENIKIFYTSDKIEESKSSTAFKSFVKSVAHQGYSGDVPGNTLQAFEKAGVRGFSACETDIRFTSDSIPVTSHDNERTTVTGEIVVISEVTYDTLSKKQFFDDATIIIPKFESYINVCKLYGMYSLIELKGTQSNTQIQSLINHVKKMGMWEKSVWVAFSVGYLEKVREYGGLDANIIMPVSTAPSITELETSDDYSRFRNLLATGTGETCLALPSTWDGTTDYLMQIRELGYAISYSNNDKAKIKTNAPFSDYVSSDYYTIEECVISSQ